MNINIQSVKFKTDVKLDEFIEKKVSKLAAVMPQATTAEVTLQLNHDEQHQNKVVDIRLCIPGNDLFANRQSDTFEEAILECIDALKRQIEKVKEKRNV